jgi:peptide deformylase
VSLRDIHLLGSPVLRQRSTDVVAVDDEVRAFVTDLFETMDFSKGVGLAANQVGVARRIAVVGVEERRYALINPVIVERAGTVKDEEGCLSIPEIYGDVERAARVVVEAMDEHGVTRRIEGTELLGRALQHEIDHLDGILFLDRVGPIKRRFLVRQWEKSRKGETGYIKVLKEPVAEDAAKA